MKPPTDKKSPKKSRTHRSYHNTNQNMCFGRKKRSEEEFNERATAPAEGGDENKMASNSESHNPSQEEREEVSPDPESNTEEALSPSEDAENVVVDEGDAGTSPEENGDENVIQDVPPEEDAQNQGDGDAMGGAEQTEQGDMNGQEEQQQDQEEDLEKKESQQQENEEEEDSPLPHEEEHMKFDQELFSAYLRERDELIRKRKEEMEKTKTDPNPEARMKPRVHVQKMWRDHLTNTQNYECYKNQNGVEGGENGGCLLTRFHLPLSHYYGVM